MRVFLSEFLTGGGLAPDQRSPSLLCEGRAMLAAVARDLARLSDVTLSTILAPEVEFAQDLAIAVERVSRPDDWPAAFDAACRASDATLVIAPETGGLLASLVRRVEALGRTAWNCRPAAIDLCTDKLVLAKRLEQAGVVTVPTCRANWNAPPEAFPVVVKPRDGAGSQLTRRIDDLDDWKALAADYASAPELQPIVQPFVPGRALSLGAVFAIEASRPPILLTVAEQHLSNDGRFTYEGGLLPADLPQKVNLRCAEMIRQIAEIVSGLRGYVGFDLLLPDATPHELVLAEINPRLTTSFVGYARLSPVPLASLWLSPEGIPVTWPAQKIAFTAAGDVREV